MNLKIGLNLRKTVASQSPLVDCRILNNAVLQLVKEFTQDIETDQQFHEFAKKLVAVSNHCFSNEHLPIDQNQLASFCEARVVVLRLLNAVLNEFDPSKNSAVVFDLEIKACVMKEKNRLADMMKKNQRQSAASSKTTVFERKEALNLLNLLNTANQSVLTNLYVVANSTTQNDQHVTHAKIAIMIAMLKQPNIQTEYELFVKIDGVSVTLKPGIENLLNHCLESTVNDQNGRPQVELKSLVYDLLNNQQS